MAGDRTVKSISFSELDPFEVKLLAHAEQFRVFSTYIKRLIQRDMENGGLAGDFIQQLQVDLPVRTAGSIPKVNAVVPPPKVVGFV